MEDFYIEYFIENKYELPVRKANFQLLVIPDPGSQRVQELKFYCSEDQEMHISKNIFGFETINYYISNPFSEFWFKLSAKIEKQKINPFYISPLLPFDEFELIHSLDFQIDNSLFLSYRADQNAVNHQLLFSGIFRKNSDFRIFTQFNQFPVSITRIFARKYRCKYTH